MIKLILFFSCCGNISKKKKKTNQDPNLENGDLMLHQDSSDHIRKSKEWSAKGNMWTRHCNVTNPAPEQIFNREVLWRVTIACCSFAPNKRKSKDAVTFLTLSPSIWRTRDWPCTGSQLFRQHGSVNSLFIALCCYR